MIPQKLFTLVFLKRDNLILLGRKTRGIGQGFWNGFGGKIEKNESITECAKRELKEECNLIAEKLNHIGVIKYEAESETFMSIVHIFTCIEFKGNEEASEEMNPIKWYHINDIPFHQMWPDSKYWYSLMLMERFFSVHVVYNASGIISHQTIMEYDTLKPALELIS